MVKDQEDHMNIVLNKRKIKVMPLYDLAVRVAKLSCAWKDPSIRESKLDGFIISEVVDDFYNLYADKEFYLERKFSIKRIGIEEAVRKVYPNKDFEVICNKPERHKFLFYKDEDDLRKYVKSHTKVKPITAVYFDL